MLSRTSLTYNFFPMGRRGGATNAHLRYGLENNVTARIWNPIPPKSIKRMKRDMLTLDCPMCTFRWDFDALTVHCPAIDGHNKREHWLAADWLFRGEQPYKYYSSMPVTFNPRTHQVMADGWSKSKNNERRMQGLTTKFRNLKKQEQGMSRHVSNIGKFSSRWATHFPYPT